MRDVRDRIDDVAELLAARVDQARTAGQDLTGDDVAALIHQAVDDVRRLPRAALTPGAASPAADSPEVRRGRELVDRLYATAARLGELTLEIAPAYLTEDHAARLLADFADHICLTTDQVLARRLARDLAGLPAHGRWSDPPPPPALTSPDRRGKVPGTPGRPAPAGMEGPCPWWSSVCPIGICRQGSCLSW